MNRISVIMPAYNAAPYLEEAVESVRSQSFGPVHEIVIGTAPSTDGTTELAAALAPPVRCVPVTKLGDGVARNVAIEASTGDWLAFLDADDIWSTQKLELQAKRLADDPALEAVFGHVQDFRSPDWTQEEQIDATARPGLVPGTMLIRRSSFMRVGRFDESITVGTVVDWALRAKEAELRMHMLPEVLLHRRIHGSNMGRRLRSHSVEYARVLKASLDRRRAGTPPTP